MRWTTLLTIVFSVLAILIDFVTLAILAGMYSKR